MKTRVYYGEYTLRHWLRLMLTRNIELPSYQRSFVWEEKDIMRLVESLTTGQFVPPITIAHFEENSRPQNLILDGQQRLTSLLLAYIGYIPIKEKFENAEDLALGDDSREEDSSYSLEWVYKMLLKNDVTENTLSAIEQRVKEDSKYRTIEITFLNGKDNFFDETFLGFSYIVPDNKNEVETQKYFSTLFRNMNYLGKKLSPLESRRSLYFMNIEYKDYFDGKLSSGEDVLCNVRIMENKQAKKIDFVRYLAILSQYYGTNNYNKVLVGYSAYSSRESYYADYVSYIVKLEQETRNTKFNAFDFSATFPNNLWRERFSFIHDFFERHKSDMGLEEKYLAFTSWIDADYWLFGLLYYGLFKGISTFTNEETLINEIRNEVSQKRQTTTENDEYQRNPNRLGNLRKRLEKSISIVGQHVQQ